MLNLFFHHYLPNNWRFPVLHQKIVGAGEMVVAEETAIGREGRGVGRGEDEMARAVDESPLLLRVAAPEHKYQVLAFLCQGADGGVGESFPSVSGMRCRLMGTHGEGGVEQ